MWGNTRRSIGLCFEQFYLHWFEKVFHGPNGPATWAKAKIVRYADDFVVLARYQGEPLKARIESQLEGRFRLILNRQKHRRSQRRYRPPAGQTLYAHLQNLGLQLLPAKGGDVVHALQSTDFG